MTGRGPSPEHDPLDPSCVKGVHGERIDPTHHCLPCRKVEQEQVWVEEGRGPSRQEAAWETEERWWKWITRASILYFVVMVAAFIWKGLS